MSAEKVRKQVAQGLADVSLKLGTISADSICCYIFHQPKMPEELKRKRDK